MINKELFILNAEIESAFTSKKPVVALESTVIAHGLPSPLNLGTALRLETIVREAGAVPATIAILEGKLRVGLDDHQIRQIASSEDIKKISTRDLSIAVARNWNGATTVASTLWIGYRAGIKV